jgi:hypothetical protein
MTTDQGMERIVRSWLEPGLTTLTDDVLDAVMDQLPATPQRRRWSARRIADMNPLAKYAIATAAVVVIALVGFNLLVSRGDSQVGGVASPSAAPSSSPAPLAPETSEIIDAGRYRWSSPRVDVTFDLPDGWNGRENFPGFMAKNEDEPGEFGLNFTNPRYEDISVSGDPCEAGELVPVGETVDNLVTALDDQVSTDAIVGEIAAGSVTGKRIELRQAPGLDRSQCRDGVEGPFLIWANGDETDFNAWGVLAGQEIVYVFDVDGTRLVFAAPFGADAPAAQIEEVDAIVESFAFSPH